MYFWPQNCRRTRFEIPRASKAHINVVHRPILCLTVASLHLSESSGHGQSKNYRLACTGTHTHRYTRGTYQSFVSDRLAYTRFNPTWRAGAVARYPSPPPPAQSHVESGRRCSLSISTPPCPTHPHATSGASPTLPSHPRIILPRPPPAPARLVGMHEVGIEGVGGVVGAIGGAIGVGVGVGVGSVGVVDVVDVVGAIGAVRR